MVSAELRPYRDLLRTRLCAWSSAASVPRTGSSLIRQVEGLLGDHLFEDPDL